MAVAVAAPVVIGLVAEAGVGGGGDGGGPPLEVAGSEVPPPVEVDGKGAPPVEGVTVAVTAGGKDKKEEEEEHKKKRKKKEEEKGQGVKWLGHYSSTQDILLVGDGDFSFSLALATAFGSGANLVATSLDTYETLKSKYSKAESNITNLKRLSATVLHGVDTKKMKLHPDLKKRRFDRIVFNFPHAGFKGKEDDMHMINSHRELVWGFFNNALHLLRPYCEIHISHKTGGAYDRWDIEDLAFGASLVLVEKVAFQQEDYPGYNQKRGDSARSDEAFDLGTCFTFMFRIRDLNWKKLNGDMASSVGIMALATERGPFHLFPPDEAWPRQRLPPPVNAVHMPTTVELDGVAQSQHPDFALNFDGTVRDPYFQQPGNTGPMLGTPGLLVNALHNLGGAICPPMSRIPCPDLLAPQEKPWYQHRPTADAPGRDQCYLARENQWGLQREYEMQGHVMPAESHSALLEHQRRDWEFVQEDRRMVIFSGGMW
ncbi:hypothetical protein SETIT_2G245700v2 [Setaria italica]|uniref:25S rRNA (uridine-N(3))-methyltransferase BMT5-like domain-containing protein n=2 Tax=Setaria italica TaxID=4555 RepID=A0A368Q2M8_SETIT|nr:hypothetical protein SETIT_2G245700v2 [Setaria italica]